MVGMSFFIGCGIYRVNPTGGKRWLFTENSPGTRGQHGRWIFAIRRICSAAWS